MTTHEIYWLAGLLDGEGCFSTESKGNGPIVTLAMTDLDLIQRAAPFFGKSRRVYEEDRSKRGHKNTFRIMCQGSMAAGLMMTIWPLMSRRRQEKIREVLTRWRRTVSRVSMSVATRRCATCGVVFRRSGSTHGRACATCRKRLDRGRYGAVEGPRRRRMRRTRHGGMASQMALL